MFSICFVTAPSIEVAKTIGTALVQKRLIACCNILGNCVSIYSWQGKIETDTNEHLMIMKTRTELVPKIVDEVKSTHPYECPEVVSFIQGEGNPQYLKWLAENTNFAAAQVENVVKKQENENEEQEEGKSQEKK